jgi:hypothetical protein
VVDMRLENPSPFADVHAPRQAELVRYHDLHRRVCGYDTAQIPKLTDAKFASSCARGEDRRGARGQTGSCTRELAAILRFDRPDLKNSPRLGWREETGSTIVYGDCDGRRYNMYEKRPCSQTSPAASSCRVSIDSSKTWA